MQEKSVSPSPAAKPANVDADRILNADREPGNWMTHGRTYSEQRFSPLRQISEGNIGRRYSTTLGGEPWFQIILAVVYCQLSPNSPSNTAKILLGEIVSQVLSVVP
jgi:hypothetical protein